jgi:excisionase family DNA binding protein
LEEARQAREAARAFAGLTAREKDSQGTLRLLSADHSVPPIEVPASAFHLFVEVLNQMALGHAVTLVPTHRELTTQEAADLLRVSRPYFVKLLETGEIPFHRVGVRRRIKFEDLGKYMEKVKGESRDALAQLAAEAQHLKLGY